MKILTISIAAYNVERYLEKALDSLCVKEIIDDIEILVIDDGSKDNTGRIAKKYQELYPATVKYIKKDNGGHGSTINKGIELACGKYFRVLDGDDYVDTKAFVQYVNWMKNINNDMIINNFMAVNFKGERRVGQAVMENGNNPFDTLVNGSIHKFDEKYSTRIFGLSSVTIKTELLKWENVCITENCFYVDVEFIIWCIGLANDFIYMNLPVYMYLKDDNADNSVSKVNMIKNVSMQEKVSYKICSLYENFKTKQINGIKLNLIMERIAISVGATIRTYMLFDDCKLARRKIIDFDNFIKKNYKVAYDALSANTFIKAVRACHYLMISPVRLIYRIYIKRR